MESMSITRFELYKIFSRKSIWILLAIMLVGIILPLQLLVASSDHPPVYQPTQPTPQQVQQAKTDLPNLQQEIQQSGGGRPAYWKLWHQYQSAQAIVDSASGTAVRGQMKRWCRAVHPNDRRIYVCVFSVTVFILEPFVAGFVFSFRRYLRLTVPRH